MLQAKNRNSKTGTLKLQKNCKSQKISEGAFW